VTSWTFKESWFKFWQVFDDDDDDDDDDYDYDNEDNNNSDSASDIFRLYVNREGGRSLLQIEMTCRAKIINVAEYLNEI
jgi:hypothetical protein